MEGEKNLQAREKGIVSMRSPWSIRDLLPNGLDLFSAICEEAGEERVAMRGKALR